MRRPSVKDFLAMECGTVTELASYDRYLKDLIREWAIGMGPTEGRLPGASGRAFAEWLDHEWDGWTEEEDTPVQKILEGAVTEWCGGRAF